MIIPTIIQTAGCQCRLILSKPCRMLAAQLNSRVTDLMATCASRPTDAEPNLHELKRKHAHEAAELQQQAQTSFFELSSTQGHDKLILLADKASGLDVAYTSDGSTLPLEAVEQATMNAEEAASLRQEVVTAQHARAEAENSEQSARRLMQQMQRTLEQKICKTADDEQTTPDWPQSLNPGIESSCVGMESSPHTEGCKDTSVVCESKNQPVTAQTAHDKELLACLAERAKAVEVELATVNAQMSKLKSGIQQSALARTKAADAIIVMSTEVDAMARGWTHAALTREHTDAWLEAPRTMQEMTVMQLHKALAESRRETADARQRVAAAEEKAATAEITAQSSLKSQLKQIRCEAAKLEERARTAEMEHRNCKEAAKRNSDAAKSAKGEVSMKQKEIDAAHAQLKHMKVELEAVERAALEAEGSLEQRLRHAEGLASERAMQLVVLTDTVEALQSQQHTEWDQRLIDLTAQLVASRGCEASQRSRNDDLIAISNAKLKDCVLVEQERDALQAHSQKCESELKSLHIQHGSKLAQCEQLQLDLERLDSELNSIKQERHADRKRIIALEAESESLRNELAQSTCRHFEQQKQLWQELQLMRQCDRRNRLIAFPRPKYLQDFSAHVLKLGSVDTKANKESTGRDEVLISLQKLVIAAEGERCAACVEAQIAHDVSSALMQRLQGIEKSHQLFQQQARTGAQQLSIITAQLEETGRQGQLHMSEMKAMLDQRVRKLQDQLLHAQIQRQSMACSLQSAAESEQGLLRKVRCLSDDLSHVKSELECAQGKHDALRSNVAIHASASVSGVEETVAARDAEIKDCICSHIATLMQPGQNMDHILAVTRELAAAKLSEAQLLANVASSDKRCDTHVMRIKHLEAELCRCQRHARCTAHLKASPLYGCAAHDIAAATELQRQLICKDEELHQLRHDFVELQQQCEKQQLRLKRNEGISDLHSYELQQLHQQSEVAIAAACKSLEEQHTRNRVALEAEINASQRTVELQQASMQQKEVAWQNRLNDCEARLQAAQKDASLERVSPADVDIQVAQLAQELSRAYMEISELQSKLECREGSILLLEKGLAAIERRCAHAPADANTSKVAYSAFTKQILQSNMAQAEAHRRLKVAAREGLEYQQRLAEQSSRIQELKVVSDGNVQANPHGRSASADRCKPRKWQQMAGSSKHIPVAHDSSEVSIGVRDTNGHYMQTTNPHIVIARKDAEIDSLKKQLASALASASVDERHSSGQNHSCTSPASRSSSHVDHQVTECIAMLSNALGDAAPLSSDDYQGGNDVIGGRLHSLCKHLISELVQHKAQERSNFEGARHDCVQEMLVVSQRSVISSLTARSQEVLNLLASAQHESGRLRERVRLLRASMGEHDPECENLHPLGLEPSVADLKPCVPAAVCESTAHASEQCGLIVLLHSHLNLVLQHQQQLTEALEGRQWHGNVPGGGHIDQHVLIQPLQESARELAAMEATLHVLRCSIPSNDQQRDIMAGNGQLQSPTLRDALQPLADADELDDSHVSQGESDGMQSEQKTGRSSDAQDVSSVRVRVRQLEHECRKLRRVADEASLLQSQLKETSQECTEWQRRHTDVQQELHKCAATAASAKLAMQSEVHQMQLSMSKEREAMLHQITQLEQQVSALEADKETAIKKCEAVSAEVATASKQATSKTSTVEKMQIDLEGQREIIQKLQHELDTSHALTDCEKKERLKLIEALRGTIEQVRAAGHEEERLHAEMETFAQSLAQEHRLRQQQEQQVARKQEEVQLLTNKLAESAATLLGSQKSAQDQAILAQKRLLDLDNQVHSLHEQLDMAESAFARRLDDLSSSILSVSEHTQFPRELLEELESIDHEVGRLRSSFEEFQNKEMTAKNISQRRLESERVHMQQELVDLQVQLQDCQRLAETEGLKLQGELEVAQKDADLAKADLMQLKGQISLLEQQAADQQATDEDIRTQTQVRHKQQLQSVQESHEAVISNMHSVNNDLQLQLNDLLLENSALLTRVKAAEEVAKSTAQDLSRMESSWKEEKKLLQEEHDFSITGVQSQLDQTRQEFYAYQHAKQQEIVGLERRIRDFLVAQPVQTDSSRSKAQKRRKPTDLRLESQSGDMNAKCTPDERLHQTYTAGMEQGSQGLMDPSVLSLTVPAGPAHMLVPGVAGGIAGEKSEIGVAAAHDAIIAAQREIDFEKLARVNTENQLEAVQRKLCQERQVTQQLRTQLKQAKTRAQLVPTLEAQLKQQTTQTHALQESVCQLQSTLKNCKGDLCRKSSQLQAAQDKEKRDQTAQSELTKEREAHAMTTSRLEQARFALQRKSAMIMQLKQPAALSVDAENVTKDVMQKQHQIKELQATLSRKEDMLKQMRANRDVCKQKEAKIEHIQEAHGDEVSRLKSDVQRKHMLLIAAKEKAERLESDLHNLQQDHQLADAIRICAQKVSHVLVYMTVALCRMLLRTTSYMHSGSVSLRAVSLPARAAPAASPASATGLLPDDVAVLVGLSVHEVVDLLGTPSTDMTAVVAGGGSAAVAYVAELLTAIHEAVQFHEHGKDLSTLPDKIEGHVKALTAVMQEESRKSETSFDSCITALPALVRNCTHDPIASETVQGAFQHILPICKLSDRMDKLLMLSLDFYIDPYQD
eukprot:jgi/Ulvmu1/8273/UM041_0084.1